MIHAGQSSARARRERARQVQGERLRTFVDDLIWDQHVAQAPAAPAWVRPMLAIGGLIVTLAWIGAVAHGCGS